jgi:hypothetical protein
LPLWDLTTAKRQPLARVERVWRGVVMDTYALEKLTGWTPDLSPAPDSPLFRWRVLAGNFLSCHPRAGEDPARCGSSVQSRLSLEYWVARSTSGYASGVS